MRQSRGAPVPNLQDLQKRRVTSVTRLLFGCYLTSRDRIQEKMSARGYADSNMGHGVVLRHLDFEGTPLSVITRRAGVSRQAIAKVAAELVELGYVRLDADPEDRRAKIVRPTKRGLQLIEANIESYEEVEREIGEIIGRRRLELLRTTLRMLYEAERPG